MSDNRHCPTCGYTEEDAKTHMDHRLCRNDGKAPWQKPTPNQPTPTDRDVVLCDVCRKPIFWVPETDQWKHVDRNPDNSPGCWGNPAPTRSKLAQTEEPLVSNRMQGVDCPYCEDGTPHIHASSPPRVEAAALEPEREMRPDGTDLCANDLHYHVPVLRCTACGNIQLAPSPLPVREQTENWMLMVDEVCCEYGPPEYRKTDDGEAYYWCFPGHDLPVADDLSELLVAASQLMAKRAIAGEKEE